MAVTSSSSTVSLHSVMSLYHAAGQRILHARLLSGHVQSASTMTCHFGMPQAKYLAGQGVARQRQAIINGLRDSIKNFSNDVDDVNSKDVIEMMMITQYFDMLRDVGSR